VWAVRDLGHYPECHLCEHLPQGGLANWQDVGKATLGASSWGSWGLGLLVSTSELSPSRMLSSWFGRKGVGISFVTRGDRMLFDIQKFYLQRGHRGGGSWPILLTFSRLWY
jgi:hypothetical protein